MSWLSGLFGPGAFAIDLSDRSLRLLALGGAGGKQIRSTSEVEVPEGLIQHAEIKDQEAVSELIRTLVEEAGPKKVSSNKVIVGVPEAQVYSMHVTAPKELNGEELDALVLKKATNFLPFTLETIAWDYNILSTGELEHDILFAAVRKEIVQAYANTVMLAGLDLIALEPEATSLTRALVSKDLVEEEKAVAIIDIGGRGTRMVFADALGQQLSISKAIGGMMITEALAKKKKLTAGRAEKKKIKDGLKGEVKEIVEKIYDPLIKEFMEARAYYEGKTKRKVTTVLLSGGAGQMKGLDAFLTEKIGLQVTLPEMPLSTDEMENDITAVLAGLAMRAKNPKLGLSFVIPD